MPRPSRRVPPYPEQMAKPRDPAATKAAKAEAKATRKAASKQRRSQLWQAFQIQRKEDKRLLPYMIGAFVLIVGASAAFGILAGGGEHREAALVAKRRADPLEDTRDGFDVVRQHFWTRLEDLLE